MLSQECQRRVRYEKCLNQAGHVALLVGTCFFIASLLLPKASGCFIAQPPNQAGRVALLVGTGFFLASLSGLPGASDKVFLICPNQAGHDGTVGQDFGVAL